MLSKNLSFKSSENYCVLLCVYEITSSKSVLRGSRWTCRGSSVGAETQERSSLPDVWAVPSGSTQRWRMWEKCCSQNLLFPPQAVFKLTSPLYDLFFLNIIYQTNQKLLITNLKSKNKIIWSHLFLWKKKKKKSPKPDYSWSVRNNLTRWLNLLQIVFLSYFILKLVFGLGFFGTVINSHYLIVFICLISLNRFHSDRVDELTVWTDQSGSLPC